MITGKEDLLQSFMEAFLMEKGTREFYSQASDKALNEEARNVFRDLALWETKHMEYIQYLYMAIQEDLDMEGFDAFIRRTESPIAEGGIPVKELETKLEQYTFLDDSGALMTALEIEGKSYNLYRRLSEKVADTNAKVVFKEMMQQELRHIDHLKGMRTKLAETS